MIIELNNESVVWYGAAAIVPPKVTHNQVVQYLISISVAEYNRILVEVSDAEYGVGVPPWAT